MARFQVLPLRCQAIEYTEATLLLVVQAYELPSSSLNRNCCCAVAALLKTCSMPNPNLSLSVNSLLEEASCRRSGAVCLRSAFCSNCVSTASACASTAQHAYQHYYLRPKTIFGNV